METVTVTIINEVGLHARPTSLLTKLAKEFKSEIEFYKNNDSSKKYQAKSIMSVMKSSAVKGDQLTFEAEGTDEKEAVQAICSFIEEGCGE